MNRRGFLALLGVPVLGTTVPVLGTPVEVTGMLGGPDVEGGYFELIARNGNSAHEVIVMTPINSPLYQPLRDLVGRDVVVTVAAID